MKVGTTIPSCNIRILHKKIDSQPFRKKKTNQNKTQKLKEKQYRNIKGFPEKIKEKRKRQLLDNIDNNTNYNNNK